MYVYCLVLSLGVRLIITRTQVNGRHMFYLLIYCTRHFNELNKVVNNNKKKYSVLLFPFIDNYCFQQQDQF